MADSQSGIAAANTATAVAAPIVHDPPSSANSNDDINEKEGTFVEIQPAKAEGEEQQGEGEGTEKSGHARKHSRTASKSSSKKNALAKTTSGVVDEEDGVVYPGPLKLTVILVGLCLAVFLVALDQTIIATAIPKISDHFKSINDIGWYGSAYLLTTCSFQLFFGKIYTYFPVKWTFLTAIMIFELGSVVCGAAPSSSSFIVGRAIAGLGCAGIFSGSLIILAHSVPLRKRSIYSGLIGGMWGIASVTGPLLGGVFTDSHLTWRWCFYINLPVGAVTIVAIAIFFHSPERAEVSSLSLKEKVRRLDIDGLCVFIPAIICILLALQWGGVVYKWNSWRIILLLTLGCVLVVIFAAMQVFKGENATIPMRIFKVRAVYCAFIFAAFLGGAFFVLIFYMPIWFQAIKNVDATQSGVRTLALLLSVVVSSMIGGIGVAVIGYYAPWMIISSIMMAIACGLLTMLEIDSGPKMWLGYQIFAGLGLGLGMQQGMLSTQAVLPMADVSIGTSVVVFANSLGGALTVGVATNIFNDHLIAYLAAIPGISGLDGGALHSGATNLRAAVEAFNPDLVIPVLKAYNEAITKTFYIAVGMSVISLFPALGTQWVSVKGRKIDPSAAMG